MDHLLVVPIRFIANVARKLSGGKWKLQIHPHIQDEIGELAHSFNFMANAMQEQEETLKVQKTALQKAHDEL